MARSQIRDLKEVEEAPRGTIASAMQMMCSAPGQAVYAAREDAKDRQ
jgi:hypothetical protein